MEKIETLVKKLETLAKEDYLSAEQKAEAREVMRQLKAAGMTNAEIHKVCSGRWALSTVKDNTTGIGSPEPSPWHDALEALKAAVDGGVDLAEIKEATQLRKKLKAAEVTVDDVIEFITIAEDHEVDAGEMVCRIIDLKESKMSLKQVGALVTALFEMEENGLEAEDLPVLAEVAGKYGDIQSVVEAIDQYGSLAAMQARLEDAQAQLGKVEAATAGAEMKLSSVEAKLKQLEEPLQAYQKVLKLGFDPAVLANLSQLAERYGSPKSVLASVAKYKSLKEIAADLEDGKSRLAKLEGDISQTEARKAHLLSAIKMCETLIRDKGYGLDAVEAIYDLADGYGSPDQVIKAVHAYGSLINLNAKKGMLESDIQKQRQQLVDLDAQFVQSLKNLDALNAQALDTGKKIGSVRAELEGCLYLRRLFRIFSDPDNADFDEHGVVVLEMLYSLKRWVKANQDKFQQLGSIYDIKKGLSCFIQEMGGAAL